MVHAAFALILSVLLLGPSSVQAADGARLVIELHGGRFTLQADDAPLADVLERLAEALPEERDEFLRRLRSLGYLQ